MITDSSGYLNYADAASLPPALWTLLPFVENKFRHVDSPPHIAPPQAPPCPAAEVHKLEMSDLFNNNSPSIAASASVESALFRSKYFPPAAASAPSEIFSARVRARNQLVFQSLWHRRLPPAASDRRYRRRCLHLASSSTPTVLIQISRKVTCWCRLLLGSIPGVFPFCAEFSTLELRRSRGHSGRAGACVSVRPGVCGYVCVCVCARALARVCVCGKLRIC